ncbi:MAG: undecaprenyldiphospho-muramoylpentapeptide beta-N-acetylglucosaminyltransferase [Rikenellaceae bacterium]
MIKKKIKIIASGGGTAGHIYPAISVIKALEQNLGKENLEVLFVGAEGKMEMRIVPENGYRIQGLKVRGLIRKISFENVKIALDLWRSILKAGKIIKEFNPDVVIGFGGYASAPIMFAARNKNICRYVWEGNSFAGLSNRLTGKYAKKVFVSYDNMQHFFPDSKIVVSGNPIQNKFSTLTKKSPDALATFGFEKDQKIILITGGSLGARNLNEATFTNLDTILTNHNIGVIWQTGSYYYKEYKDKLGANAPKNVFLCEFIKNMEQAYSAADIIICRSGASTVTEVAQSKLAAIFVPSSGVTDDHQTKNAKALAEGGAAMLVKDSDAKQQMIPLALSLLNDENKLEEMRQKIGTFAKSNAAQIIAEEILKDVRD